MPAMRFYGSPTDPRYDGRMARVAVLLLLLLACGACGPGPQRVGEAPSWRAPQPLTTTAAAPAVFAPEAPAVAMYNRPGAAAPSTRLGDAVVKAVKDAAQVAGIDAPFADARLFRACEELAQIVPEQGVVAYRVVEFVMQRNGLIEPSPHLLVVWGDLSDPALIVEQLAPRFADIFATGATARVGIGAAARTDDGVGAVVSRCRPPRCPPTRSRARCATARASASRARSAVPIAIPRC